MHATITSKPQSHAPPPKAVQLKAPPMKQPPGPPPKHSHIGLVAKESERPLVPQFKEPPQTIVTKPDMPVVTGTPAYMPVVTGTPNAAIHVPHKAPPPKLMVKPAPPDAPPLTWVDRGKLVLCRILNEYRDDHEQTGISIEGTPFAQSRLFEQTDAAPDIMRRFYSDLYLDAEYDRDEWLIPLPAGGRVPPEAMVE